MIDNRPGLAELFTKLGVVDTILAEHVQENGRCRVCGRGTYAARQAWPCTLWWTANRASQQRDW